MQRLLVSIAALVCAANLHAASPLETHFAADPKQKVDAWYGEQIARYTTDPSFNTQLTDYLPASDTVPTPAKALGDVSGAPNMLPRLKTVYDYFRSLEANSPRVKVYSIGKSEEGREMIAVAIADEKLLADLDANRERLAQLADPRKIGLDDERAAKLIEQSVPVYYITATIHSPETGSPTSVMELAYRLAVDDAPYIQAIRSKVITLITPVVETDGWERKVDIYNWHRAHPEAQQPPLLYWGHYVAHDNNRDAMLASLALTRNVINTYTGWHAQVLHDMHESVPFLYDNTVGAGPYNAWVDPLLVGEWQQLGWNNVDTLTRLGLPGVFTHGEFDTWSPGYLMFIAATHNGISRLYETFGNGGADTEERILDPSEYERTWYRPNPPRARVMWSQRNNNNYSQSAMLTALDYFSSNSQQFLRNFWLKSKRSVTKAADSGPAGYVLSADDPRRSAQQKLLEVLHRQKAEVMRLDSALTVQLAQAKKNAHSDDDKEGSKENKPTTRTFPAGSYVVRMDQPYSRIADVLLDRQYWSPDDPQKHPYDDTGWSLGDQFGVDLVRVTDAALLKAPMQALTWPLPTHTAEGSGAIRIIANPAAAELASLRFAEKGASIDIATRSFTIGDREFAAGSLIARRADSAFDERAGKLGLRVFKADSMPDVTTRKLGLPRVAIMHTWLNTQTEGWWRMALDNLGIPFTYISTQDVARSDNLRKRFDVILFGPIGYSSTQLIVDGLPMYGNAMPWKKSALTPNLGLIDSTDDIRPGLGGSGVDHLKRFVRDGGLLITSEDTAKFAIDSGLAPGVSIADKGKLVINGSLVRAQTTESESPVTWGYGAAFTVYSEKGMAFKVSNQILGDGRIPTADDSNRPTGRGGPDDIDLPQGAGYVDPPELPSVKPWQAVPLNAEQARNNIFLIPEGQRPRALLRFADSGDLLVSGLLDNAGGLARKAAVVDARLGKGHVLLFAINPMWRAATIGSYPMVTNAILNFDSL
ncbi:MAG TPA: M14 family zinc carboxypeptidase [Dokdonella sp.]|uniref:M14 family zinc carboxypeptidase n=1 Tax=Dokdonella sp. TaxID=2291710 RepID=UPI002D7EFFC2|nr:M14 family zinc carboxypeptidase [Dokdonella sp.]HET9033594.1 M14 family zinc carboxypeptidase [Dokdonella sp.]